MKARPFDSNTIVVMVWMEEYVGTKYIEKLIVEWRIVYIRYFVFIKF